MKPLLNIFKAKNPLRSVPVADDPSHRVHAEFKGDICTGVSGGHKTLYDVSKNAFIQFSDQNCMATREYLGLKKSADEEKGYDTFDKNASQKKSAAPPVKVFGSTQYKTFAEVGSDVHKFGAALREAGLVAAPKTATLDAMTTPCSLAIFENTSAEWMIAAQGAFSQSIIVTTIYATLGMDAVADAIQECAISAIVCNKRDVANIVERAHDIPTIKTIIYTSDAVAKDDVIVVPVAPSGVTIVSFEDFVASGDIDTFPPTPPSPKTAAVVMYTSGSTGKPKGVIISHEQIVAATGSGNYAIGMTADDVYLGYLPLAHIMELMAEFW